MPSLIPIESGVYYRLREPDGSYTTVLVESVKDGEVTFIRGGDPIASRHSWSIAQFRKHAVSSPIVKPYPPIEERPSYYYDGLINKGDRFKLIHDDGTSEEIVVVSVTKKYVTYRREGETGSRTSGQESFRRRVMRIPHNSARPNRRGELAEFLKTRGFPEEAVEYFEGKASRDGYITDKEPPPPSTLEDPALRAMEDLERAWKYLEIVWAEYNIYGEK